MTNDELREKAALAISANLDIEETERADSFALEALALDVHRIANVLDELRDGVRSIGPLLRMVPGAGQLFGAGLDIGVDLKGKENKIEEVQPAPPDWVDDALKDG